MKKIQFTSGCPNNCSYCYEGTKQRFFNPRIPNDNEIQILDMNFLSNPNCKSILKSLEKKKYELVCGIDYRFLDQEIANLMKLKGFHKIRWAWDYNFGQQRIHQKTWKILTKAGFRWYDLQVFVLANWKIPFIHCVKKLDLLTVWNVEIVDCCFDGGYPKNEIDFNNDKRFNKNRFWKYNEIKEFRKMCRKRNHLIRYKIDPEFK